MYFWEILKNIFLIFIVILGNNLGDKGLELISKALMNNNALTYIGLSSKFCVFIKKENIKKYNFKNK